MGLKRTPGSHPNRYRFACERVPRKSVPGSSALRSCRGQMRRRAPGQLGKITLPFRLTSNKTRRAIAVFRARPSKE